MEVVSTVFQVGANLVGANHIYTFTCHKKEEHMIQNIKKSYEHTIYASYVGYITQAVVNNFTPLLFLTLVATYGFSLEKITLITTVNFFVQLFVDLVSVKLIDRIGYRPAIVAAHLFAAAGIAGLAVLPQMFSHA